MWKRVTAALALCIAVLLAGGCHGTMKSGSQNNTDSGHGSGGGY